MTSDPTNTRRGTPHGVVRIAAVGDIHVGDDLRGKFGARYATVSDEADVFLIAGDLTRCGTDDEAHLLVDELSGITIPIVAVLGNHDVHSDDVERVTARLTKAGITVLEGDATVIDVRGTSVAIAGTIGFGHGFLGGSASEFGEPVMKLFVRQAKSCAAALDHALRSVCADVRIALTHYAPVEETLGEEPREIFPFLGSYLLGEVADEHDVDLYLHGHAHRGAEYGTTPGGVPVRNVAQPVLEAAYRVYEVHAREAADHAAQPNR